MALGSVVEIFFGVRAGWANLERIAKPLTATEDKPESNGQDGVKGSTTASS